MLLSATFLNKYFRWVCLGVALYAFISYSWLSFSVPGGFSSPDEAANNFFAEQFARSFDPRLPVNTPDLAAVVVHPRSTFVLDGNLVPQSFLGLPLTAGLLARLLSLRVIPFLTPFLAAAAIFAMAYLLRRFLPDALALTGGLFLLFHPGYAFYASRSMFHNVGFVALLVIGLAIFLYAAAGRSWWQFVIAGMCVGLGLAFRLSEAPWVMLGVVILWFWFRRSLSFSDLLKSGIGVVAALLPFFLYNLFLYGRLFTSGYHAAEQSTVAGVGQSPINILSILFPFGVDPMKSIVEAWKYLIVFIPWYGVPALLGFVVVGMAFLRKKTREATTRPLRALFVITAIISAWLVLVYGSWDFHEASFGRREILGSSYLRYWLPIFLLSIPFLLVAIQWLAKFFARSIRTVVLVSLIAWYALLSYRLLFFDPLYGLVQARSALVDGVKLREAIVSTIPNNAVIISGNADKVLFPRYLVIHDISFLSTTDRERLRMIAQQRPVYLLINALESDVASHRLTGERYGIRFADVDFPMEDYTLFQLQLAGSH